MSSGFACSIIFCVQIPGQQGKNSQFWHLFGMFKDNLFFINSVFHSIIPKEFK